MLIGVSEGSKRSIVRVGHAENLKYMNSNKLLELFRLYTYERLSACCAVNCVFIPFIFVM